MQESFHPGALLCFIALSRCKRPLHSIYNLFPFWLLLRDAFKQHFPPKAYINDAAIILSAHIRTFVGFPSFKEPASPIMTATPVNQFQANFQASYYSRDSRKFRQKEGNFSSHCCHSCVELKSFTVVPKVTRQMLFTLSFEQCHLNCRKASNRQL